MDDACAITGVGLRDILGFFVTNPRKRPRETVFHDLLDPKVLKVLHSEPCIVSHAHIVKPRDVSIMGDALGHGGFSTAFPCELALDPQAEPIECVVKVPNFVAGK